MRKKKDWMKISYFENFKVSKRMRRQSLCAISKTTLSTTKIAMEDCAYVTFDNSNKYFSNSLEEKTHYSRCTGFPHQICTRCTQWVCPNYHQSSRTFCSSLFQVRLQGENIVTLFIIKFSQKYNLQWKCHFSNTSITNTLFC